MTPEESRMAAYKSAYEAANGTGGGADSSIEYRDGEYWLPDAPMSVTGRLYTTKEVDAEIKTLRRAAKARTK